MDINLNYADDDNPLGMKSDFILSLCELIMGARDGMEPEEKSVIDRYCSFIFAFKADWCLFLHRHYSSFNGRGTALSWIKACYTVCFPCQHFIAPQYAPCSNLSTFRYSYLCIYL